ncbi:MAG: response regulator transcription factor [Acidobacteriia bacterium]|nr:response regulator transcription factor [Terriglobia bacterium]
MTDSTPSPNMLTHRTVAVCETQPITAEGVRSLIDSCADLKFLRATDSLVSAGDVVKRLQPDLMIIDKSFGSQAVLLWLSDLKTFQSATSLIVWGNSITEPEALRLLQGGVRGILRKTADSRTLLACLRAVAGGANWMEDSLFRESPRSERYHRSELTPRERQVLEQVEQGLKNKEIARELGIQPGTVKIHLKHIFEKTGVRGRYGLALTGLKERGVLEMSRA